MHRLFLKFVIAFHLAPAVSLAHDAQVCQNIILFGLNDDTKSKGRWFKRIPFEDTRPVKPNSVSKPLKIIGATPRESSISIEISPDRSLSPIEQITKKIERFLIDNLSVNINDDRMEQVSSWAYVLAHHLQQLDQTSWKTMQTEVELRQWLNSNQLPLQQIKITLSDAAFLLKINETKKITPGSLAHVGNLKLGDGIWISPNGKHLTIHRIYFREDKLSENHVDTWLRLVAIMDQVLSHQLLYWDGKYIPNRYIGFRSADPEKQNQSMTLQHLAKMSGSYFRGNLVDRVQWIQEHVSPSSFVVFDGQGHFRYLWNAPTPTPSSVAPQRLKALNLLMAVFQDPPAFLSNELAASGLFEQQAASSHLETTQAIVAALEKERMAKRVAENIAALGTASFYLQEMPQIPSQFPKNAVGPIRAFLPKTWTTQGPAVTLTNLLNILPLPEEQRAFHERFIIGQLNGMTATQAEDAAKAAVKPLWNTLVRLTHIVNLVFEGVHAPIDVSLFDESSEVNRMIQMIHLAWSLGRPNSLENYGFETAVGNQPILKTHLAPPKQEETFRQVSEVFLSEPDLDMFANYNNGGSAIFLYSHPLFLPLNVTHGIKPRLESLIELINSGELRNALTKKLNSLPKENANDFYRRRENKLLKRHRQPTYGLFNEIMTQLINQYADQWGQEAQSIQEFLRTNKFLSKRNAQTALELIFKHAYPNIDFSNSRVAVNSKEERQKENIVWLVDHNDYLIFNLREFYDGEDRGFQYFLEEKIAILKQLESLISKFHPGIQLYYKLNEKLADLNNIERYKSRIVAKQGHKLAEIKLHRFLSELFYVFIDAHQKANSDFSGDIQRIFAEELDLGRLSDLREAIGYLDSFPAEITSEVGHDEPKAPNYANPND
jgi:hypothetical protein